MKNTTLILIVLIILSLLGCAESEEKEWSEIQNDSKTINVTAIDSTLEIYPVKNYSNHKDSIGNNFTIIINNDSLKYKSLKLCDSIFCRIKDESSSSLYTIKIKDSNDTIFYHEGHLLVLANGDNRYLYSLDIKGPKKDIYPFVYYIWIFLIPLFLLVSLSVLLFYQKIKKGPEWKGKKIVVIVTIIIGFLVPVSCIIWLYLDPAFNWFGDNSSPFVDTPVWFLVGLALGGGVLGYFLKSIIGYFYREKYVP